MWFFDAYKNRVNNLMDAAGRGVGQSANVALESLVRTLDIADTGRFYVGKIIRAGGGTYDVTVRSPGGPAITCVLASQLVCYYYGVSDCAIPIEGTRVVIQVPHKASPYGVVIGVLPPADLGSSVSADGKTVEMFVHQLDLEPAASSGTEAAYSVPLENKKDTKVINAHAGRPLDVFPGNRVWINEQGVKVAILNLLASIHASDRAKIEVSVIDDLVRIVSGYYRHIHSQGEDQIYNDGGMLTREIKANSYQCEKSGYQDYGQPLTAATGDEEFLPNSDKARYQLVQGAITSIDRLQIYMGYLGDLINVFVSTPALTDADAPESMDNNTVKQGLMHAHIDGSGRLTIRTAAGVCLERWDRIPVPKKKHEPWDPAGDKMEEMEPGEKLPVEFDSAHPYGRSLQLRDAQAWRAKLALQRFYEQSQGTNHKDYFLPEEGDMSVPPDEYDRQGKAQEQFSVHDLRRASIGIEDDGSIILTDAWGSEIIMRGGNIIFNCAGQMELRTGKSIVQLAGHDIIAKARKSLDLTATENDVRVKANRNLQMVSEGRGGSGGGILLESKSQNDSASYQSPGEQARGAGIVLKAANSRVFMQGRKVHLAGEDEIMLEGFDESGSNANSKLRISVGQIWANALREAVVSVDNGAGLIMRRDVANIAGEAVRVMAGSTLQLTKGAKVWLPLTEADIDTDPYGELAEPVFTNIYEEIQETTDWLGAFKPENREDIRFTYRSSAEYGTLSGTEVKNATKFYVYEASWAYMLRRGSQMIGESIAAWQEYPIEDTYPWPGKDVYDAGTGYVQMTEEANISNGANGIPKKRAELTPQLGTLRQVSFHEYEVIA